MSVTIKRKKQIETDEYNKSNEVYKSIQNNELELRNNNETTSNNLNKNPEVQLYSTWGNGSNLIDWKNEIKKLPPVTKLVSPSRAARVPKGESKELFILHNWKKNIVFE